MSPPGKIGPCRILATATGRILATAPRRILATVGILPLGGLPPDEFWPRLDLALVLSGIRRPNMQDRPGIKNRAAKHPRAGAGEGNTDLQTGWE